MWQWSDEDQHQWRAYREGVNALYSAWVDRATAEFSHDPFIQERMPAHHDSAWFRTQLESYRPVFCGTPDSDDVRDANRAVGFAHIKAQVLPSWYVGLYNLIFDAYHRLEEEQAVALPPLGLVRRRWLTDIKTVLDTYDVVMAGKIDALNALALSDPLTGLFNRRGFRQRVTYDIDHAIHEAALILIDLDCFKAYNDVQGHPAGDLRLQHFADLCRDAVPPGGALSRLGGDEFAWWVVNPGDSGLIREQLTSLAKIARENHQLFFSAGLARFPLHGADLDPLYQSADNALYRAKQGGRNRFTEAGSSNLYLLSPQ